MRKRLENGQFSKEHGYTGTKIYSIWKEMRYRCENKQHPAYQFYGGRGIRVCERWKLFKCFMNDTGDYVIGNTLERINNNGDYSPKNCIWASRKEQANNRRSNRIIKYAGVGKTLSQWADILMIKSHTIANRIDVLGWGIKDAFTAPVQKHKLPTEQK